MKRRKSKSYSAGPLILVLLVAGAFMLAQNNQEKTDYEVGREFIADSYERDSLVLNAPIGREGRAGENDEFVCSTGEDERFNLCSSGCDRKQTSGVYCIKNTFAPAVDIAQYDRTGSWIRSKEALKDKSACFEVLLSERYTFEIYYCHLPKAQATCIDSDGGKDYGRFGTVSGIGGDGNPFSATDGCSNDKRTVIERYCDSNNEPATVSPAYSCPSGEICENGKCGTQQTQTQPAQTQPAQTQPQQNQQTSTGCGINTVVFNPGVFRSGSVSTKIDADIIQLDVEKTTTSKSTTVNVGDRALFLISAEGYHSTTFEGKAPCASNWNANIFLKKKETNPTLQANNSDNEPNSRTNPEMMEADDEQKLEIYFKTTANEYFGNFAECDNLAVAEYDKTYIKSIRGVDPKPVPGFFANSERIFDGETAFKVFTIGETRADLGLSIITIETTSTPPEDTRIRVHFYGCDVGIDSRWNSLRTGIEDANNNLVGYEAGYIDIYISNAKSGPSTTQTNALTGMAVRTRTQERCCFGLVTADKYISSGQCPEGYGTAVRESCFRQKQEVTFAGNASIQIKSGLEQRGYYNVTALPTGIVAARYTEETNPQLTAIVTEQEAKFLGLLNVNREITFLVTENGLIREKKWNDAFYTYQIQTEAVQ